MALASACATGGAFVDTDVGYHELTLVQEEKRSEQTLIRATKIIECLNEEDIDEFSEIVFLNLQLLDSASEIMRGGDVEASKEALINYREEDINLQTSMNEVECND